MAITDTHVLNVLQHTLKNGSVNVGMATNSTYYIIPYIPPYTILTLTTTNPCKSDPSFIRYSHAPQGPL